jgi:Holliday junction DNA helicase RuvA
MIGAIVVDYSSPTDDPAVQLVSPKGVGIAYEVRMNEECDCAILYTHVITKEDGQTMYGFETANERDMFRKLLTAKGIGGETAMRILASMKLQDIVVAIADKDPAQFTKIKGVGEKAAQAILKIKIR